MARQSIGGITPVVADFDDAKSFYCDTLGFDLIEDTPMPDGKRRLLVAPPGSVETRLLLAKAVNSEQQASVVGNQTGGRVFLFLHNYDFWRDYKAMQQKGVRFHEEPRTEAYGTVVVFEDLYGNRWDLLQLAGHA